MTVIRRFALHKCLLPILLILLTFFITSPLQAQYGGGCSASAKHCVVYLGGGGFASGDDVQHTAERFITSPFFDKGLNNRADVAFFYPTGGLYYPHDLHGRGLRLYTMDDFRQIRTFLADVANANPDLQFDFVVSSLGFKAFQNVFPELKNLGVSNVGTIFITQPTTDDAIFFRATDFRLGHVLDTLLGIESLNDYITLNGSIKAKAVVILAAEDELTGSFFGEKNILFNPEPEFTRTFRLPSIDRKQNSEGTDIGPYYLPTNSFTKHTFGVAEGERLAPELLYLTMQKDYKDRLNQTIDSRIKVQNVNIQAIKTNNPNNTQFYKRKGTQRALPWSVQQRKQGRRRDEPPSEVSPSLPVLGGGGPPPSGGRGGKDKGGITVLSPFLTGQSAPRASNPGGVDFSELQLNFFSEVSAGKASALGYAFKASITEVGDMPITVEDEAQTTSDAFFVWLALPSHDFWVNLNPNEPNRIIVEELARTAAGRILLEADFQLKKTVATLIHPDSPLGQAFWNQLYEARKETPLCFSFRQWIVPGNVTVWANADSIYIVEATLDVKLESTYMRGRGNGTPSTTTCPPNARAEQLFRTMIAPTVIQHVNTAPEYRTLRNIFYARIVAAWYETHRQLTGRFAELIDTGDASLWYATTPWDPKNLFNRYIESVTQGEFHLTKTTQRNQGNQIITKSQTYFYGGVDFTKIPINHITYRDLLDKFPHVLQQGIEALLTPTGHWEKTQTWFGGLYIEGLSEGDRIVTSELTSKPLPELSPQQKQAPRTNKPVPTREVELTDTSELTSKPLPELSPQQKQAPRTNKPVPANGNFITWILIVMIILGLVVIALFPTK